MRDDFMRGCAILLAATVMFSISDTMAKYLTESLPPVEFAFFRYLVFVAMALIPYLRRNRPPAHSRRPSLQVVRAIGVVGSAICFILSLGTLPVAEATAINFITPLIITVFAIPVLGEVVTGRGWLAVLLGFVGMLVVVRPGAGAFHPAAGLVVLSSMFWATAILATRKLAAIDRSEVTLLWTSTIGFLAMAAALPFFWRPPSWTELVLCLAVGVVASAGQFGSVIAYRYARATALAPLTYLQLIWSSALGYLVFGSVPDRWIYVGALIIAASGLYIVRIERSRPASPLPDAARSSAAAPARPRASTRQGGRR